MLISRTPDAPQTLFTVPNALVPLEPRMSCDGREREIFFFPLSLYEGRSAFRTLTRIGL